MNNIVNGEQYSVVVNGLPDDIEHYETVPDFDDEVNVPVKWNYRLRTYDVDSGVPGMEPEMFTEIIEVYYNVDGDVVAWSDSSAPYGETVDEVRGVLERMIEACNKPVLTNDDLPGTSE